jgi:hypothetical protein
MPHKMVTDVGWPQGQPPLATTAADPAASIAMDTCCIAQRLKLDRKASGNSCTKAANPLASLEAVACLPNSSRALRHPSTYGQGARSWQLHRKLWIGRWGVGPPLYSSQINGFARSAAQHCQRPVPSLKHRVVPA